jgi:hypothetical protein
MSEQDWLPRDIPARRSSPCIIVPLPCATFAVVGIAPIPVCPDYFLCVSLPFAVGPTSKNMFEEESVTLAFAARPRGLQEAFPHKLDDDDFGPIEQFGSYIKLDYLGLPGILGGQRPIVV